jgi:hypothetical protein
MKNNTLLVFFQLLLSFCAGYLVSKMSWIGRLGISISYHEYAIFKSWWKTGFVFFLIQLLVLGILIFANRKYSGNIKIVHIIILLIASGGLYFTYHDFQHTLSHRLLKERFHLGFYLFWIGWIISCVFTWKKSAPVSLPENR